MNNIKSILIRSIEDNNNLSLTKKDIKNILDLVDNSFFPKNLYDESETLVTYELFKNLSDFIAYNFKGNSIDFISKLGEVVTDGNNKIGNVEKLILGDSAIKLDNGYYLAVKYY